jgi:hypothetical protein
MEGGLQMVLLSATRFSCIAILWVSIVSFAAVTLCVASQRVFIFVVYFVIDSVQKLLNSPSWFTVWKCRHLAVTCHRPAILKNEFARKLRTKIFCVCIHEKNCHNHIHGQNILRFLIEILALFYSLLINLIRSKQLYLLFANVSTLNNFTVRISRYLIKFFWSTLNKVDLLNVKV